MRHVRRRVLECATTALHCSLVQVQQCSLAQDHAAAPMLQSPARGKPPASAKKKETSGTSCDAPRRQPVVDGATSSTREPICGLLSPKGQAHTPPGNLWLYKNAGSLCYECLRTDARKTTRHKTRSAADGRRASSRGHRRFSISRRESHFPRRRAGLWRSK